MQPQPNCEHQPCWVLAIDLYVSDAPLTRVPVVAQADNSAHKTMAANVPLRILFMIDHLSSVVAQGIEWTGATCSTFRNASAPVLFTACNHAGAKGGCDERHSKRQG